MSYSYERRTVERRMASNRTALGYWVPLALTVTAAAVGIGAWIWSERSDADDDADASYNSPDAAYARRLEKQRRAYANRGASSDEDDDTHMSYGRVEIDETITETRDETFMARMSNMVGRAPSPQQMYDGASKRIAAGMAAVGRGLRSIQEEKDDFGDHERWSEEAESREKEAAAAAATGAAAGLAGAGAAAAAARRVEGRVGGKRKTVCVVVSAEDAGLGGAGAEDAYHIEHVSILSHLVGTINPDAAQLVVLIYAPHLTAHPLSRSSRRASSAGSYEQIDAPAGDTDDEGSGSAAYANLQAQAQALVAHPTHILPFTTPTGHIHLLRHLAPSLVYLPEEMAGGQGGEVVAQVEGWVGQVVVVVGLEGAGLADTETEDEGAGKGKGRARWWQDGKRVGLGKGVEVVDGSRVGEDWVKRVEG